MNAARVAALLRELADEFESTSEPVPPPKASRPRRVRHVRPAGQVDEVTARRVAKRLKVRGFGV